jgi:uncharacterized NAD(P)/FAD-binding protein YdhS
MAKAHRLGIIGAGPYCTYALERIAAHLRVECSWFRLELHVFDPTGQFGAGSVHSPEQPRSSPLNRIAGQIAFCADETNQSTSVLLPAEERTDFLEWCREQFRQTAEPRFDLDAESWPQRYLHGLALRSKFDHYREAIEAFPSCRVLLHAARVDDLEPIEGGGLRAHLGGEPAHVDLDHVLLATGHTANAPSAGSAYERLSHAARDSSFHYIYQAYPLVESLSVLKDDGSGSVVGCRGMGLTAYDVILYLTEGRGGCFVREGSGSLRYVPSGREPSLVVFSRSGVFTSARPYNAKEADPPRLEHRGVFFTEAVVDRPVMPTEPSSMCRALARGRSSISSATCCLSCSSRCGSCITRRWWGRRWRR